MLDDPATALTPPLTPSEALRLARLHGATLPGSLLSQLGAPMLARFYRFAAASPLEWLFVGESGAAVLSLDSASLQSRFIGAEPLRFGLSALVALVTRPGFAVQVAGALKGLFSHEPPALTGPEVTHIFVDPAARGRGVGAALLGRVERRLADLGERGYGVRTLAEDNAATLTFYALQGFEPARRTRFCGHDFIVLTKALSGKG